MAIFDILRIALNALKVNKLRSILTMLGVIIGVSSVILLVSIGSGLERYVTEQFEELGTDLLFVMPGKIKFGGGAAGREGGPPGSSNNKLTSELATFIERRAKLVTATTPISTNFAQTKFLNEERSTGIMGTSSNYAIIRKTPTTEGRFFTEAEEQSAKKVAVIGQTVKEELFKNRPAVGEKIRIANKLFTVIGELEAKGAAFGTDQDDLIIIPITTFQQTFDLDKVSYIYAKAKSVDFVEDAKKEIENILLLRLEEDEFSVIDPKEFTSTVTSILGVLTAGLAGIAAISLVVGGIGIANIMLVSVTERIREIGLRKAVGANSQDILLQFLAEAAVLSIVGGIIGIALGISGSLILNQFVHTSITFWSVSCGFIISALTGIISGVGPAIRAARLNPIDALRHE